MSTLGFPDSLQFSRLSSGITDLKSRSEQLRVEVVTGRITDPQRSLGPGLKEAYLLRKAIDDSAQSIQSSQRALSRAGVVQQVLSQIRFDAEDLSSDVTGAIGLNNDTDLQFGAERAREALKGAFSLLNTRYAGRSLFSGDAVDSLALSNVEQVLSDVEALYLSAPDAASASADIEAYFNDPSGTFETTIYSGGEGAGPKAALFDRSLVSYTIKANDDPVKDILRAYSEIAAAGDDLASDKRDIFLSASAENLTSAEKELIKTSSLLGLSEERLQDSIEVSQAETTILKQSYNDRTAVDPFAAASELQQLESQLQASFLLTSRISQLSLSNYL